MGLLCGKKSQVGDFKSEYDTKTSPETMPSQVPPETIPQFPVQTPLQVPLQAPPQDPPEALTQDMSTFDIIKEILTCILDYCLSMILIFHG